MDRTSLLAVAPVLRQLEQLVVGAARQQRPPDRTYALVEHVWHLADLEVEGFAVRIERLLAEVEPRLADFDGDRVARERRYHELPIADGIARFDAARRANVARLAAATPAELARGGTQDEVGAVTLGGLPAMMRAHDRDHAQELVALVRDTLGLPVPPELAALA